MRTILWLWLVFLLQASVPVVVSAGTNDFRASLQDVSGLLQDMPDTLRLKILEDSLSKNSDVRRVKFARLLLEDATEQGNTRYQGTALFALAQYYYTANPDSMRYYILQAEPILQADNRLDELFRLKAWNIFTSAMQGQEDEVLAQVQELRNLSDRLNFPEGKEMADQALANFYKERNLIPEALDLYESVLVRMDKRGAPLIKRFRLIRILVNLPVSQDIHAHYMEMLQNCIAECERLNMEELGEDISLDYIKYVYYRTLASDAYEAKRPEELYANLQEAEQLVRKKGMELEIPALQNLWILYYEMTGQYDTAIRLCNELIKDFESRKKTYYILDFMLKKGNLYYLNNQGMAASETYRAYIALKDSVSSLKFYDELAKLKAQHDMDKLEIKNKEMALAAERAHSQVLTLGGSLLFFVLACIVLAYIAYSRHKYGKQLKIVKEKAEEADRLKSAFLANMNHEIRTPLNAIVGFSQILVDEEDSGLRSEYSQIIQSNNELLQRLIEDVLDISKIESNSMTFSFTNVFLPELMRELYTSALLRMPPKVSLELDAVPDVTLPTDRSRLMQIISNLLNNAIKHTLKGTIRIGVENHTDFVCFYVEDTGEGIPKDKLNTIFSRFVQLNEWNEGVGLGLAICKGLIEKMGGTISVESEQGKGSVFYVTLLKKEI